MQIEKAKRRDVATPFRWRTGTSQLLLPEEMTCSHIANTLIMIWNHSVPERMQTHAFNHYRFDARYDTAYMRAAVAAFIKELDTRKPLYLNEVQRKRLNIIRSWMNTPEFEEVFAIKHVPKLEGRGHGSKREKQGVQRRVSSRVL